MPHLLSYGAAIVNALYKEAAPALSPRVLMTCRAKFSLGQNANGSHTFSTTYRRATVDITNRLDTETPIRVVTKKPEVPTGSGADMRGANVTVSLINTDGYWAVSQDGAILDPGSITNAYIEILLPVGSVEAKIYRGRVIGMPAEEFGRTTFTVRDAIADLIEKPLRWENLSEDQAAFVDADGQLVLTAHEEDGLRFYAPFVTFDATGLPVLNVSNSKGNEVDARIIDFAGAVASSVDLGSWSLRFTDSQNYILTGPNVPAEYGNILVDLDAGFVKIPASSWVVNGDPTGAEIAFSTCYTVSGNPVSIMKRILERAFLQSWGLPSSFPNYLPVDWAKFNRLEDEFAGVTVYFSETNRENSVFSLSSGSRPVSVKNALEWLAEHIGSAIVVDDQGRISITSVHLPPNTVVYDLDSTMIESHQFPGGRKKYDLLSLKYGTDYKGGGYQSESVVSNVSLEEYDPGESYEEGDVVKFQSVYWQAVAPNAAGAFVISNWVQFEPNIFTLNLRYFKTGTSDLLLPALSKYYFSRLWFVHEQVTAKVLPAFGVFLRAGDVVRLVLSERPRKTIFAEIVRVSKQIGGEVSITAQRIPEPLTPPNWCAGSWCSGTWG